MTETQITQILIAIAKVEGKIDGYLSAQLDHEKRLRALENNSHSMIAWSDIAKIVAVTGSLVGVVFLLLGVNNA